MDKKLLSQPVNSLVVLATVIAYIIASWSVKIPLFTGLTISLGMFTTFSWETVLLVSVVVVDLVATIMILRWGHKTSSVLKVNKSEGRWMIRLALIVTYLNLGVIISVACILLLMALFAVAGTVLSFASSSTVGA